VRADAAQALLLPHAPHAPHAIAPTAGARVAKSAVDAVTLCRVEGCLEPRGPREGRHEPRGLCGWRPRHAIVRPQCRMRRDASHGGALRELPMRVWRTWRSPFNRLQRVQTVLAELKNARTAVLRKLYAMTHVVLEHAL